MSPAHSQKKGRIFSPAFFRDIGSLAEKKLCYFIMSIVTRYAKRGNQIVIKYIHGKNFLIQKILYNLFISHAHCYMQKSKPSFFYFEIEPRLFCNQVFKQGGFTHSIKNGR